jgi:putative transposase
MDKFKNKYRIPSARLPNWDYANDGAYFITICTANRQHFFGECVNGKMALTTAGIIVQGLWYDIPNHSPTVELGEFVVMPNHIHGILILDNSKTTPADNIVETLPATSENGDNENHDDENTDKKKTLRATSLQMQKISPKSGSVSRILGSYKSSCTRHINLAFPDLNFGWQTRFWDNIIRDDQAFENISNYIVNNPKSWKDDKFFDE